MSDHLFVYGTLMSGFDNSFAKILAEQGVLIGEGTLPGHLYRVDWFPGAVYLPDCGAFIHGEVIRLPAPETTLLLLDEYEEVDEDHDKSLYLRRTVPVRLNDKVTIPCWVYLYNQEIQGLERIASGNFRICHHIT